MFYVVEGIGRAYGGSVKAPAERPSRAHAPSAQAGDGDPARLQPSRAAARLRSLPPRVQPRATPRGPRAADADLLIRALPPASARTELGARLRLPRELRGGAHRQARVARWHGHCLLVSSALHHELLGLQPIAPDAWQVHFGPLALGHIERPSSGRFRLRFERASEHPRGRGALPRTPRLSK